MTAPVLEVAHGKDAEIAEAVLISGPRRGQIIRLREDDTALTDTVTPEEWGLLNAALDNLLSSLDRLSDEIQETTAAFKKDTL